MMAFGFLLVICTFATQAFPDPKQELPLYLSAADGIDMDDKTGHVTGKKNLKFQRSDTTLYGQMGKAHYKKIGSQRQIEQIDLFENVLIVTPEATCYADEGIFNILEDVLTLKGKKLVLFGRGGTLWARETLKYKPQKKKADATGHVHLISTDGTEHLYADHLTAQFLENAGEKPKTPSHNQPTLAFESLEGRGNVKVVMPGKAATADYGFYDATKDEFFLKGHVHVRENNRQLTGDSATVNRKTGKSRVWVHEDPQQKTSSSRRVRILLLPEKKGKP